MNLVSRQVGPWGTNAYALICPTTKRSVLIDPGSEPEKLTNMLQGSIPIAILLTHSDIDHIGALEEMKKRLAVPLIAHPGPHAAGAVIAADRWVNDGELIQVGTHTLQVYHAPGHIGDQICFAIQGDNRIIVGDTIFDGGPGRTRSSADFQTTLATLRHVVLLWPDSTICYPGHGSSFRLGDRKQAIKKFLKKDHGSFFGDATWDM
ncbi:MAG: MBL fold metallo-hydrolase [Candidatus Promineifilaceae bacterium]|nr:MBL fold metallo-hydrolase [Candidatus Promineifilaceae bacterium]